MLYALALAILAVDSARAYLPTKLQRKQSCVTHASVLHDPSLLISLLQKVDKSQASAEFFFFFFGGSGALGIGAAQVPRLLSASAGLKARAGAPSEGGEELGVSPLATFGYPEPLRTKDIEKIIREFPESKRIQALAVGKSYMSQMGYLEREAFDKSLPKCNPVAMYAVYDAASGGGGDLAPPQIVEARVNEWRQPGGIEKFKNDLLSSNLKKLTAFGVFAFLILLVLDLVVESGINAFL